LQLLGSAQRITGDFSNATVANRVMFQTSAVNGNTVIAGIPNGTSDITSLRAFDSADVANARFIEIRTATSLGDARINVDKSGTGTYLPMTFHTGGSKQAEITTAGLFQFNSGYGSVATAYGCRAWVNFNGTGTVAIRASGNVTSITDNGTGDYTVNFTNAMPDANYAYSLSTRHQSGVSRGIVIGSSNTTPQVGSFRIEAYDFVGGAFTLRDVDYLNVVIFR
jgi:hypothetical protein